MLNDNETRGFFRVPFFMHERTLKMCHRFSFVLKSRYSCRVHNMSRQRMKTKVTWLIPSSGSQISTHPPTPFFPHKWRPKNSGVTFAGHFLILCPPSHCIVAWFWLQNFVVEMLILRNRMFPAVKESAYGDVYPVPNAFAIRILVRYGNNVRSSKDNATCK